jgi:hypothetical protein
MEADPLWRRGSDPTDESWDSACALMGTSAGSALPTATYC